MNEKNHHYNDYQEPSANEGRQTARGHSAPPADVLRDGALKATIWQNEGEKGPYFTTKLAKTYEDKNGNIRDTDNFGQNDLLRIAELARSAYARGNELRREFGKEQGRSANVQDQGRSDQREAFRQRRSNGQGSDRQYNRDTGGGHERSPVPRRDVHDLTGRFPSF
ncbi:MAG: hypothetical protein AAF204_05535 [Pseudomonadota bacterium]